LKNITAHMTTLAAELEQHLPKWELFISQDKINYDLCEKQVLANPFRAKFSPKNELLSALMVDLETCCKELTGESIAGAPEGIGGNIVFLEGLRDSVDKYVLIQVWLSGCGRGSVYTRPRWGSQAPRPNFRARF
jgi:hypothetical protein